MVAEEVDSFLTGNNIDTAAARELRNEAPHIQLAVLERGPLRACTNPSGALVARIRDAKRGVLGQRGNYGGAPAAAALDANASAVDKFLVDNQIDQAGVASFRSETPEIQRAVMAKGNFVNTTNPSASLMARIRTVKMDLATGNNMAPPSAPGAAAPPAGLSPGLAQILGLGGQQGGCPPPPPGGPLSLEDARPPPAAGGGIQDGSLDDEARRAIEKLSATMATQAAATPKSAMAEPPSSAPPSQSFVNTEDMKLNDEALRIIQGMNQ